MIKTTLLAAIVSMLLSIPEPPVTGLTINGRVVRVVDGDTLVCESVVRYHVRLIDCWSPESRTTDLVEKKKGLQSKLRMTELSENKQVRIQIPFGNEVGDSITMGRVLGRVWLEDGRDLSEIMVTEGLATKAKK